MLRSWTVNLLVFAVLSNSACGGGSGPFDPEGASTGAVHVYTEPRYGDYPVELFGPENRTIRTDQRPYHEPFGPSDGYAFVDNLEPGTYSAVLGPLDPAEYLIVRDSVGFEVGPRDTTSITFVLAPMVSTITVGDTGPGPVSRDEPWKPHGYRIQADPGATVDLRLAVGGWGADNDYAAYRAEYEWSLYDPYETENGIGFRDYDPTNPRRRIQKVTILPKVSIPETGEFRIIVARQYRGVLPEWYGLSVRNPGPVMRAFIRDRPLDGPWDQTAEDTVWAWNAIPEPATWSAFSTDPRAAVTPESGDLPHYGGFPSEFDPPPGSQPIMVRINDGGLDPWSTVPIQLRADGDDWGRSEVRSVLRLHDPRIVPLADLTSGSEAVSGSDVILRSDGSAVVGSPEIGLLEVDLSTGSVKRISTFLDQDTRDTPQGLDLSFGPDGSIWVLVQQSDDELWRIRSDGSEELVLASADFSPVNRGLVDVAVAPDGSIYLASSEGDEDGLWTLPSEGAPLYLGRPDPACCKYIQAIAHDPSSGRIYLGVGDITARLVAFDPVTGEFATFSPPAPPAGDEDRPFAVIREIAVDQSGRVYGTGNIAHPNVVFRFDPISDSWIEEIIGPRWLHGVAIADGRVLLTTRSLNTVLGVVPARVYSLQLDDPSVVTTRE